MIFPELRSIQSPDLEPPALPADTRDCEVVFRAIVGPKGEPGEEVFGFIVVTSAHLQKTAEIVWGRGHLIVAQFDWRTVVQAIAELLVRCARPSWSEVVAELNKYFIWESDTKQRHALS